MRIFRDYRRLRASYLIAAALLLPALIGQRAFAQSPAASEDDVQRTAVLVLFASTFCGTSEPAVQTYKAALRRSASLSWGFDSTWNLGWSNEEDLIIQYLNLRWSDPDDFASRVRADCGLVGKQIEPGVEALDVSPKVVAPGRIADRLPG